MGKHLQAEEPRHLNRREFGRLGVACLMRISIETPCLFTRTDLNFYDV
jgi:hypothetical protein